MTMQFASKKILIGALAFSLVAGSGVIIPASYASAASGYTTPFTDVSSGHWAEKHIAKLALQGIIEGNKTSSGAAIFRPKENVSQQEAVLMALRFAGLDKKADKDAIIGFPNSFSVSTYFKPYVTLAFQEGLLDQVEEFGLAAKDPKIAWGTKPATREWVTKLMVRAIQQEEEAVRLQNTASTFADAAQITSIYKGYVNAASKLELVKGVTADKFVPKANVDRASLATMFSRAEKLFPVAYEGQVNGIATKITDTQITVYSDKKEINYTINSDTLFYHYNTETPITRQQLLEYGDVTVIAKDGKALYVEVKGDKTYTKTTSGTLDRVIADEKKLYVWINNKPVEFFYNDSVVVVDTDGKPLALTSIKRDSQISIVQDSFRDAPATLKIIASTQASATSLKGTFYGASGDLITIKEGTSLVTKLMSETVNVEIDGFVGATVNELIKEADQVELTLNAEDVVTKVKVVNRNVKMLAGAQIVGYVYDKKLLTIVDANGNNGEALYFTDKTRIEFSGNTLSLASATNLLTANRKIVISYTGNTIVSLQFLTKYTGTLVSMNSSGNLMNIRLDNGATLSLPYNTASVEHSTIANATTSDLRTGDKLTLDLNANQDRVSTIKVHSNAQYEVISVDVNSKKIRVKNAMTSPLEINMMDTELTNEAGAKISIDQITPGSLISVSYIGRQVVGARTLAVTYGKVQSISANSVTIVDLVGQTVAYNGDAGFVIVKGATQGTATSLLTVGDYVEVQKLEGNKTQLTVAVGESRVFTNFNATASQVWTEKTTDADNRNYFNVNSQTKYILNGNSVSVTAFKSGDTITIYGFRNYAIAIVK
ncbi:S-layer homology domain-containing protein [Paenibacillus sp. FSL K6-3182]|uniref:S-layer homology domain-containing protein n=1 Tax=Paenibacillus sp. FSL K6-3182 TaxID=2921495 RepID=UPI0030CF9DD3